MATHFFIGTAVVLGFAAIALVIIAMLWMVTSWQHNCENCCSGYMLLETAKNSPSEVKTIIVWLFALCSFGTILLLFIESGTIDGFDSDLDATEDFVTKAIAAQGATLATFASTLEGFDFELATINNETVTNHTYVLDEIARVETIAALGAEAVAGADGADGAAGLDGIHCWDLDHDGNCTIDADPLINEDKNGDGNCTAADCLGTHCWDHDSDFVCDLVTEDKNGDGICSSLDCVGAAGAAGTNGTHGTNGTDGAPGTNGTDGADGFHCWDLNENRLCDLLTEDLNQDGNCTVADCTHYANGSIELNKVEGPYIDFKYAFASGADTRMKLEENGLSFYTGGDGNLQHAVSINQAQHVGIGTKTPSYPLHIVEGGVGWNQLRVYSNSSSLSKAGISLYHGLASSDLVLQHSPSGAGLLHNRGGNLSVMAESLHLYSNDNPSTEAVHINTAGQVGIAMRNTGGYELAVGGSALITGELKLGGGATELTPRNPASLTHPAAGSKKLFLDSTNGDALSTIDSNGAVESVHPPRTAYVTLQEATRTELTNSLSSDPMSAGEHRLFLDLTDSLKLTRMDHTGAFTVVETAGSSSSTENATINNYYTVASTIGSNITVTASTPYYECQKDEHNIPWIECTGMAANSWTQLDPPLKWRKLCNGMVVFNGKANRAVDLWTGRDICTLPEGYWPDQIVVTIAVHSNGYACINSISTVGLVRVQCVGTSSTPSSVTFDGSYYAATPGYTEPSASSDTLYATNPYYDCQKSEHSTAWTTCDVVSNGWTENAEVPFKFRRLCNGMVTVMGRVVPGSSTQAGKTLCTLPVGFRPNTTMSMVVFMYNSFTCFLTVAPTGVATVTCPGTSNTGEVMVQANYYVQEPTISYTDLPLSPLNGAGYTDFDSYSRAQMNLTLYTDPLYADESRMFLDADNNDRLTVMDEFGQFVSLNSSSFG